jgi:glutamate formiminotransferase/formiminotetrahydrofolate cyclodeaminase
MPSADVRFRDLTLAGFVDELASAEPVPGGGSASAVAASLGAGLVAMVAALSIGRPKYADYAATHAAASAQGQALADRLLNLADEDSAAYATFAAALKLPKETEAQQAERKAALRAAARTAADVPLGCVEACREVVAAAESLAGRSNLNASSDLSVACLLATAAARGAGANVLVNLPAVGDDAFARLMQSRVEQLLNEIEGLSRATQAIVATGKLRPPVTGGA